MADKVFEAPATKKTTCAPPSQRAQGRPLSAQPDFGPDFGPYFWVLPSAFFSSSRGPTSLRTFPTHWFPRLKQLLNVRKSESRMYVVAALAQCTPVHAHCGAHACWVPAEENRSARFAKAVTSSYLVDVSQLTHSFARCVGLVGRLGLGRAHVRMDSSRLYSSSKSTSDPARSPTCVWLSV